MTDETTTYLYLACEPRALYSRSLSDSDLVYRCTDLSVAAGMIAAIRRGVWPPLRDEIRYDRCRPIGYPTNIDLIDGIPNRFHLAYKHDPASALVQPDHYLLVGWYGQPPHRDAEWWKLPPLDVTVLDWDPDSLAVCMRTAALAGI